MRDAIRIVAPSYKRAGGTTTDKYLADLELVVAEREEKAYRAAGVSRLWICPNAAQGNLCRVRNWILDNAGCDRVLILDDDLSHVARWEAAKERKLTAEEVYEFVEMGFNLAEDLGVHLWGINYRYDKTCYREYTPFSFISPVLGPFQAHFRNPFRYDEKLPLKEDYDLCLRILNADRRILRLNMYYYTSKQHTNPGGCAAYRTIAREKEQFDLLQRRWGRKIVRLDEGAVRTFRRRKKGYDLNPIIRVPIKGV